MTGFFRRLRARLRYRHFNAELKDELDAHRAMAEDELRASGEAPDDVQRRAARQLGNVTLARESARGVWLAPWLESVWQDVRYAVRGLRASPSFTLPMLGVLVVTMGLTTSLFVAAESLLFRPWPVSDPHRVVSVHTRQQSVAGSTFYSIGGVEYRYLRDRATSIDLAAMGTMGLRPGVLEGPSVSRVRIVSGNYFSVLRLPLVAGRGLTPNDDEAGSEAVAVISHGLWQRQFGGAADAVGSTLLVGDAPFTVVGIAAAGSTDEPMALPEAWIPLQARTVLPPAEPSVQALLENARGAGLQLAGRLAEGADRQRSDVELKTLASQYAAARDVSPLDISVTSTAMADHPMGERTVRMFSLLALATLLMLVLGCANVGNLQLVRGLSRRGDIAVRLALGASRGRLVRQSLVEGLALSVVAAGLSVLVAQYLPRWVIVSQPGDPAMASRIADRVMIDTSSFLFAFALAVGVCLVAGLLPALRTTRISVRTRSAGIDRTRLRSGLLALQVSISAVLLVGTGLLARSVSHAAGAGLGFDPYGVAAVSFGLPQEGYDAAAREQFSRRVVEAVAQSGAGPFAGATFVPFVSHRASYAVGRSGGGDDERGYRAVTHHVTPGYFDLLRIPVVAGQMFDADSSPDDVVINQALANLLWPDEPAVGRVFLDGELERRVVAVVGDAQTENLNQISPTYYQSTGAFSALLVRNDPVAIANAQDVIRRLEPAASPVHRDFLPGLRNQLAPSVAGATTAAYIGALALLLAGVGTFGVFSYLVNERIREIGVRMALGARARDIVRLLAWRMSWPLVGGLVVGLIAALAMGRVIASSLHGISPSDPVAYLAVLLVLGVAAVVAAFIPARRAVRVDPAITLRHE